MTRTNSQVNLLCSNRHHLVLAELTQREGLVSLTNALRYLQALLGDNQSVTLGELYDDDLLWMRLPYCIRQMQMQLRSSSRGEWLTQARQVDWAQVRLEVSDLLAVYCRVGPSLECVIQDLVGVDLASQERRPRLETGGGDELFA
ncbi:MAG TPA: hypothetical protein VKR06_27690 [Ktedonosporobacter sp.]|nr:hypothetical protein [Ktedonosporobacter sp.]